MSSLFLLSTDTVMLCGIFILGASIGSFLNVCILRIPVGTFFASKRSRCPQCQRDIAFYDNIPIVSFFVLRMTSRCCRSRISWRYPFVESLTAIVFVLVYLTYPFVEDFGSYRLFDKIQLFRCVYIWVFASVMITCAFIDIDHMIIPDVISKPMILLGPLLALIHPDLSVKSSVFGLFLGGGILYVIGWVYYLLRKRVGMGFGDVKLLAAIGAWLGYQAVFPSLFMASIIGTVMGLIFLLIRKQSHFGTEVPFGPFLCGAALIHQLYGVKILEYLYGG